MVWTKLFGLADIVYKMKWYSLDEVCMVWMKWYGLDEVCTVWMKWFGLDEVVWFG
jgi:hypothetical protein